MASRLANGLLIVNDTQEISGINTVLTDSDSELSTSKAIYDYYESSVTPVSLVVGGSWNKQQYPSQPPNPEGLTFTVTYANGNSISTSAELVSPAVWGASAGTQTATFSYTQNGVTLTATKTAGIETVPTSITLVGTLGPQFINEAPNQNGVSFTIAYNNGETATTYNLVASPNLYTSLGSQAVTFYYTENNVTVSTTVTVTVVKKLKSLSYSGTWGEQREGQAVNTNGITFTATYMDDSTQTVVPTANPATWATGVGQQTVTFNYTENGITVSAEQTCNMTYTITFAVNSSSRGSFRTTGGATSATYVYGTGPFSWTMSYTENSGYCVNQGEIKSGGSFININRYYYYDLECSLSGTTGYLRYRISSPASLTLYIGSSSRGDITATLILYAAGRYTDAIRDDTSSYNGLIYTTLYSYDSSGNRAGVYLNAACTRPVSTGVKYGGTRLYAPPGYPYIVVSAFCDVKSDKLANYYDFSEDTIDYRIVSTAFVEAYKSYFQTLVPSGDMWTSTGLGGNYIYYYYDTSWTKKAAYFENIKQIVFKYNRSAQTQPYN